MADEPAVKLDSKIDREVMQQFCSVAYEQEKAVVIVSHNERIKDVAHRVLCIEDGKLAKEEKGHHDKNCLMSHNR